MAALTATQLNNLNGTTSTSATSTKSDAGSEDRFLKLLVTQMQNQDPLNPMDNAQITSQMAQINTVNGIEKLNTTVASLSGQFLQMQTLQGASLVGRGVLVEGKQVVMNDSGKGVGGFELDGAADSVKVEVLNAAGHVVDTMDMGAETSGRHGFTWTPPSTVTDTTGLTFRVTATSGAAAVTSRPLMADTVVAVSTGGDGLNLSLLRSGDVAYSAIKAFD
ncbi:MAG: flagellar hook assembly protein FlgD [Betaproteobacteria bacterium]|nr:MAG: flagellar hook assembly protein FlgD [Betaproteobacteria bacterium]